MNTLAWLAFLLLCLSRTLAGGQVLPELVSCNGFATESSVCPDPTPAQACFGRAIEIDCEISEWSDWYYGGGCTGLCYRHRDMEGLSNDIGKPCFAALEETKRCTNHARYVSSCYNGGALGFSVFGESKCKWQDWSVWSDCSVSCGGGQKVRKRHIAQAPKYGGAPCTELYDTKEITSCNMNKCGTRCIDGIWSPWQEWHECSTSCGSGLQWRQRSIVVQANHCGVPATGSWQEFRPCHSTPSPFCPEDVSQQSCMLGDWQSWGSCETRCYMRSRGQRLRQRPFELELVKQRGLDRFREPPFPEEFLNEFPQVPDTFKHYRHAVSDLESQIYVLHGQRGEMEKIMSSYKKQVLSLQEKVKELSQHPPTFLPSWPSSTWTTAPIVTTTWAIAPNVMTTPATTPLQTLMTTKPVVTSTTTPSWAQAKLAANISLEDSQRGRMEKATESHVNHQPQWPSSSAMLAMILLFFGIAIGVCLTVIRAKFCMRRRTMRQVKDAPMHSDPHDYQQYISDVGA